ncbi:MAG: UDP-N-acetylglucosamine 1-carboxyvinyltransferase, partial [Planctomycetota bacterium]
LDHLTAVLDRFEEIGVDVLPQDDGTILARRSEKGLFQTEMTTQPYPGFPTDLQAQLVALQTQARGASVVTERIFPKRYLHVDELNRMGARIMTEASTAIIHGERQLHGAPVMCGDLRASAALVMAAMTAQGVTRLDRVYHIDRGYEKIEHKLRAVGAIIERVDADQADRTAEKLAAA